MKESCISCACYEEEREYCFRLGTHTLKNGYCKNYRKELLEENNKMNKYDYYIEVANDVENWLNYNDFELSNFENREEAAEFLRDELWAEDSVTGNGPQGYASEEECEEFLCHNLNLLFDALSEFGELVGSLLDKHHKEKNLARRADCTIRCYVLDDAIENALITWEKYGFKYKGE